MTEAKKKTNSGEKVPLGDYYITLYSIADKVVSPNQGEKIAEHRGRLLRGGGGRTIFRDPLLSVYVSLSPEKKGCPDLKSR